MRHNTESEKRHGLKYQDLVKTGLIGKPLLMPYSSLGIQKTDDDNFSKSVRDLYLSALSGGSWWLLQKSSETLSSKNFVFSL